VYILQNTNQSANAAIPLDCEMDRARHYDVQVKAGKLPFEIGEATATAYVLLQDPDNGETMSLNDTATILLVTHRSEP
jgi:hypothetical protein